MGLGWQKVVPAPALEIPKKHRGRDTFMGYVFAIFSTVVYASFPVYTYLFARSSYHGKLFLAYPATDDCNETSARGNYCLPQVRLQTQRSYTALVRTKVIGAFGIHTITTRFVRMEADASVQNIRAAGRPCLDFASVGPFL